MCDVGAEDVGLGRCRFKGFDVFCKMILFGVEQMVPAVVDGLDPLGLGKEWVRGCTGKTMVLC